MPDKDPHDGTKGAARLGRPDPSDKSAAGQREFITLMNAQVRDACLRAPHFIDSAADLVSACAQMAALDITDALVRDGERLGIFTTTRLRDALLEARAPASIPVGDYTAYNLRSVKAEDALYDAMDMMLQHRIHRVLVWNGDEVAGVLSQLDLMGFLANHSQLILADIDRSADIDHLADAADQIEGLIRSLAADGVHVELIARIVGRLNRHVFSRLWSLLAPAEIRMNSCLIVMGSEGRSEQIIRTDQDNGLILRDGFTHPQLAQVTQAFTDALIRFGYPPCPGGIMLSRPEWCRTVSQMAAAMRDWVHGSDVEGPMKLAIFLDADAVAGDPALLADARAALHRIIGDSDIFHARFAAAIQQFSSDGSWWRRLPGLRGPEAAEIDVKKLGIFPVVHGARALALQYGIDALGTDQRLMALAKAGHIGQDRAQDLIEALHYLMQMKLQSNLAQIARGEAPDNAIRLASLGRIERQSLRDALAIIRSFRDWIAQHFRLDLL